MLVLAVVLMLGESAIALANPWIAGQFTSLLFSEPASDRLSLSALLLIWALLLAAQSGLSFSNRYLLGSTGATMLAGLRMRLYDHLQSLPMEYFHAKRRGDVLALLATDAERISNFVTTTLVGLLPLLITFVGALYFLYQISASIALLAGASIPLFYVVMRIIGRRLRPLTSAWMRTHAQMFATLEENIGMLPAIKAFNREGYESERFQRSNVELTRFAKRQLLISSALTPAVHLLAGLGLLLLLLISTRQVQAGALEAGDMVSILLYGMLLTRPVSGLAGVYGSVQTARGSAERLIEVFQVRPEPNDRGGTSLGTLAGGIRFEQVTFAYANRPRVLHGLALDIRPGETVALTGENGSGKSTIVHLLMRFADPDNGIILVDGQDIRQVRIDSLREQIGLVAQHVLLLNGTVRENIAYSRPDADQERIRAAARAAQAHEFVTRLPQGYDTPIGDQGVRLSGGQRQRIALARALMKDPPILILDEATSMFDPSAEHAFIHACRDALADRTVILITHRPASLALADRVLRLEHGRLVASPPPNPRPRV